MFWRMKTGKRLAATPAIGALLMLALFFQSGAIVSADSEAASSGPAALPTYLGTQVAAVYTRATRLAAEMAALYSITQLEEWKIESAEATAQEPAPRIILCRDNAPAGQARKART